jgi:hypothetical protein
MRVFAVRPYQPSRKAADVADGAEFAYVTCLRRGNALGAQWSWFTLRIEDGAVTGGVCASLAPSRKTSNRSLWCLRGNS